MPIRYGVRVRPSRFTLPLSGCFSSCNIFFTTFRAYESLDLLSGLAHRRRCRFSPSSLTQNLQHHSQRCSPLSLKVKESETIHVSTAHGPRARKQQNHGAFQQRPGALTGAIPGRCGPSAAARRPTTAHHAPCTPSCFYWGVRPFLSRMHRAAPRA